MSLDGSKSGVSPRESGVTTTIHSRLAPALPPWSTRLFRPPCRLIPARAPCALHRTCSERAAALRTAATRVACVPGCLLAYLIGRHAGEWRRARTEARGCPPRACATKPTNPYLAPWAAEGGGPPNPPRRVRLPLPCFRSGATVPRQTPDIAGGGVWMRSHDPRAPKPDRTLTSRKRGLSPTHAHTRMPAARAGAAVIPSAIHGRVHNSNT
ncbi:MAG: hypothetical protein J3K34DRAFT_434765 [Monoraphidium minutum]|nr:MAG: hypothetical protein J3K34DRAFT_434765 [Monoraphidium minutum]